MARHTHTHTHSHTHTHTLTHTTTHVEGAVYLWNMDGGDKPVVKQAAHSDCVRAVAFNNQGTTVASVSQDMALKIWTSKLECTRTYKLDTALLAVAWIPKVPFELRIQ